MVFSLLYFYAIPSKLSSVGLYFLQTYQPISLLLHFCNLGLEIRVLLQFFALFMVNTHHNMGLIAQSTKIVI